MPEDKSELFNITKQLLLKDNIKQHLAVSEIFLAPKKALVNISICYLKDTDSSDNAPIKKKSVTKKTPGM